MPGTEKTGPWFAGNEGMEKNMETTIMGYIGTALRIRSFIRSSPKARERAMQGPIVTSSELTGIMTSYGDGNLTMSNTRA